MHPIQKNYIKKDLVYSDFANCDWFKNNKPHITEFLLLLIQL